MIDITSVNPNNIPPAIEILQEQNNQLMSENDELSKYSKTIVATVFVISIIGCGLVIAYNNKKDKNDEGGLSFSNRDKD